MTIRKLYTTLRYSSLRDSRAGHASLAALLVVGEIKRHRDSKQQAEDGARPKAVGRRRDVRMEKHLRDDRT